MMFKSAISSALLFVWAMLPVWGQTLNRPLTAEEQAIFDTSRSQMKRAMTLSDRALRIGDTVTDIVMEKVFNYPNGKAKLSDFKGKHILLDFWSRGCSPCIGSFPKMEQLQLQYADKLQILAVCTYNTLEVLNVFEPGFPKAGNSAFIRNTGLPLVFNCQGMVDFFPHIMEPYLVWIDTSRVIRAMFSSSSMSNKSVEDMLAGRYDKFPIAKSFRMLLEPGLFGSYDWSQPILKEGKGRNVNKVLYFRKSIVDTAAYVLLANFGGEIFPRADPVWDTKTKQVIGFRDLAASIINIFRNAYPIDSISLIPEQQVVIESSHPEKYYVPLLEEGGVDQWLDKNLYAYEVIGPSQQARNGMLRAALKEYFNISAALETRDVNCLILKRTSNKDKLKTSNPGVQRSIEVSGVLFSLRNCEFFDFISRFQLFNRLTNKSNAMPIIDETGFEGDHKIDIDLKNVGNISGLNRQLTQYDLQLEKAKRTMEVLVLKEESDHFTSLGIEKNH